MPEMSSAEILRRGFVLDAPTPRSLSQTVYDHIRTAIITGALPPGTRLRDLEIAEVLDVSRTPVREAIRRLQDERLVVAEASRWTKVAPIDPEVIDAIYPIITALEKLAVELAGAPSPATLAALDAANQRLAAAITAGDHLAAAGADTEFHDILVAAANNPWLTQELHNLKAHLRRAEAAYFRGSSTACRSVDEHERIISALRAGDTDAAALAVAANWQASLARMREALPPSPER